MDKKYLLTAYDNFDEVFSMQGRFSDLIHFGIFWMINCTKIATPEIQIADETGCVIYVADSTDISPIYRSIIE